MNKKLNKLSGYVPGKNPVGIVLLWVLVILVAGANQLGAVGFRVPNQDPEAIARGDAFAATADNPSAIYYNPAGITQMQGDNLRLGMYVISASTEYKSPGGASAHTDAAPQSVPQAYYVHSFTNSPISIGMGVYAPYGLSLDWGQNPPFSTAAQRGTLLYLSFNPVIAWRVNKTLSLGIGPTLNYSQATLHRAIGVFPGDEFKYKGDAFGAGFNLGVLWQPDPMWSFGANYRSATRMTYSGNLSTSPSPPFPPTTPTRGAINFPQFAVLGVSFRPTTNWNLETDLDWTDWHVVKDITFQDPALGNPALGLHFQNSFIYEFGVTRQLGKGYFASVGYIYSENSSPSVNYNPLIPDSNLSLGSIGFGHHGQRWDWAVAYHFAFNDGRTIQNNTNPSVDGTYRTFNNAINISATYKF